MEVGTVATILDQAAQWATIGAFVAAVISLAVIAFQVKRYMAVRDADLRQREFENYHRLIRDLATGGQQIKLAAQTAIIFELRNYPKYAGVSHRILRALQEDWTRDGMTRHSAEMDLTLAYLERIKGNQ
jgi:hypothetical protein